MAPAASAPVDKFVSSSVTSSTLRYASGCCASSACRCGSAKAARSASVDAAAINSARASSHDESRSLTGGSVQAPGTG
eukprot:CAMPEP_0174762632 /NCGR_PEP_ID=MMETSP1094-20130205/109877_1 /TAXON_ID=156173 /ORGANISM="Chrysochromulina brevifilum, Strain UTEX LB 985" /LENGTH=77 /DNA_ID=CAMNT_0015968587 /DNA_START=1598 /DNA_END=1831 /DNA_ORIENTATION=-